MDLDRRSVLRSGVALAAAAWTIPESRGAVRGKPFQENAGRARLKLSSQDNRIPGGTLREKVEKLQQWGAHGIEFGGGGLAGRVKDIRQALAGTSIEVSAICAGYQGALISHDSGEREKARRTIKEILEPAGELGATGLIVVPAFNQQTELCNREARKILLDQLPELGEEAVRCGTRILLEPLNRQEAFFLRQVADGAAICRDAGHPGVCLMGDFYHMAIEETSDCGAFLSGGAYLHHVHLASRKRNLPGQDERSFVDGFLGLKMIGYQDFCSLECGVVGDPEVEIPKSFRFLERQWAEAEL